MCLITGDVRRGPQVALPGFFTAQVFFSPFIKKCFLRGEYFEIRSVPDAPSTFPFIYICVDSCLSVSCIGS